MRGSLAPSSASTRRGRPAASPDVHPAGRRALERRLNLAPFDARHWPLTSRACHVSQLKALPGVTTIEWRSPPVLFTYCCHCVRVRLPVSRGHVSTGMLLGIGYGLGSDSSA